MPTSPTFVDDHLPGASPLFAADGRINVVLPCFQGKACFTHRVTGRRPLGCAGGHLQAPWACKMVHSAGVFGCRQGSRRTEKQCVIGLRPRRAGMEGQKTVG